MCFSSVGDAMSYCNRCGFPLPKDAKYCPICGARVARGQESKRIPPLHIERIIQAGVLGAFFSVMISSFTPPGIRLYFIPSFISSILAIFLFKVRRLEDAVAVAFAVYLFADAFLGGITLGYLYIENIPLSEAYRGYSLTFIDVAGCISNPISALIAAYIGNKLVLKIRRRGEDRRAYYMFENEERWWDHLSPVTFRAVMSFMAKKPKAHT